MTTARFSALAGPTSRAIATVRSAHCQPPAYRPAEPVASHMNCPNIDAVKQWANQPKDTK